MKYVESYEPYLDSIGDNNQYTIQSILAYRGNPLIRTSMSFHVLFNDDTFSMETLEL